MKTAKRRIGDEGTLLLTSEDFENILIDHSFYYVLRTELAAGGFEDVEFWFIYGNQFEYFESLYSQLSKDGQILDYQILAAHILKNGFYSCSIPNFSWYFVFDYKKYYTQLYKLGSKIKTGPYKKFINGSIGSPLLKALGISNSDIQRCSTKTSKNNKLSHQEVEENYTRRFLGIKSAKISEKVSENVKNIASARVSEKMRIREKLYHSFIETFPECD